MYLASCAPSPLHSEPARVCEYGKDKDCVLYKVSGSSKKIEASFLDANAFRYSQIISSSWQKSTPFTTGDKAYITAQNLTAEGGVECEIWLNGNKIASQVSNKRYDIVICEATVQ